MAQQQADALAVLAETALHHGIDPGAPGERYQVVVHVDAPVLADPEAPGQSVLQDGTQVSAETSRRLACDASRVVMRHTRVGQVVEVGARTRTIPPALRRVLHHRDKGCRFPGCGLPFGQGHHIRHWAHTRRVTRWSDPSPPRVAHDPVHVLRARHAAQGLRIHARTACPGWLGERLDVGWAIDVSLGRRGRALLQVQGLLVLGDHLIPSLPPFISVCFELIIAVR
jgi:hypothetical protein